MLVDLPRSGINLVKKIQIGDDMENPWIMFDHIKCICKWTTMPCYVYDNTYCKVLTIACCDMQYEDALAQTLLWKNLNAWIQANDVLYMNFKGFMCII